MVKSPPVDARATPRVALVHDWLTGMRGGEKALEVLCGLYPDAQLFTLVHVPGRVSSTIERLRPRTSFVQRLPFSRRLYRHYLPLFPAAIELFDLDAYDLVISLSHCAAKSVVVPGQTRHLCYCFTPMRYAWDQFDAYFGAQRMGQLASTAMRLAMAWMARWDRTTARRADRYLAISQHVARRIRRYYNRRAAVVYPPVDTEFYHPDATEPGSYFLIVSALVPYKRLDLAIQACRTVGAPLKIVGQGPEQPRLARLADSTVEFLGARPNEEIRELYRGSAAILLPGEEDFGIVPVEAQACGRPVVALARGGALETVTDGINGVLVEDSSPGAFAEGLDRARRTQFDGHVIRAQALRFSRERFAEAMQREIAATLTAVTEARA